MESITVSISNDYQQPIKKVDNHSTSLYRNTLAAETIDIDAVAEEDLELNNADSNKSNSNFFEKVGSAVSGVAEGVTDFFEDTAASVKSGIKTVCNGVNDWAHDVHEWWNNDASPFLDEIRENFSRIITSTGATVAVGVQSFVEGLLNFGESIVDFGIILSTAFASIGTLVADGVSSLISGKSFDASITKAMWDNTMGVVSQKCVSTLFDSLYEDTKYGQFLKNNAFGFDTVRGVGSGIGYVAGVSALTIATFGVGGAAVSAGSTASSVAVSAGQMAVVAGAAGVGKGAQDSWADGASLGEGLAVGVLTGIWEGLQFYVGAKIGGSNIAGSEKALNKILSGLARVTLDGLDGGVEGFIQPLIASVYKDGYTNDAGKYVEFDSSDNFFEKYREIFDDYGGWTNVFTQAAVGVGSSLLGEAFDLRKYLKNENNNANTPNIKNTVNVDTDFDMEAKLNRYNEILNIMKSDEYKKYVEYGELGYAQELKPEFYGIERELASLKSELSEYYGKHSKIEINSLNLKQEILNTLDPKMSFVSKARKLYLELNKRVSYDVNYLQAGIGSLKQAEIYTKNINFNNLDSNRVICKSWSQLYKELLIDAGFHPEKVKIMGGDNIGSHKWVEIILDDSNIIIADAAENIKGMTDLARCKASLPTNGFLVTDNSSTGIRLSTAFKKNLFQEKYLETTLKELESLDYELGYNHSEINLSRAQSLFGNSELYQQTFDNYQVTRNLLTMKLPENMDGVEAYTYYNQLFRTLPNDSRPITELNFLNIGNDSYEGIFQFELFGQQDQIYGIFSKSTGKQIFTNYEDYVRYLKQLKIEKRK